MVNLHRTAKEYGCRPNELLRDTDFRYAIDEIVRGVGAPEDREWEVFLATGKRLKRNAP